MLFNFLYIQTNPFLTLVTEVVAGQSRLGGTKIRIILNIALILHFNSCVKDRDLKKKFGESLNTNEYLSIKQS